MRTMRPYSAKVCRVVMGAVVAGLVVLAPTVASAHLEAEPGAVEAGAPATVGFVVEHGCEGSPTVELSFEVPAEVTEIAPVAKTGWDTAVDGRVVTFSGGSLDPDTTDTFEIGFVAPTEPGTIYFPVVQSCEVGETSWIEILVDGAAEPELPAPAVRVTDGPPTTDDVAGGHDGDEDEEHHETEPAEEVADADEATASDSGGVNGGLIAAGVVGIVIVAGTALVVRKRRDTSG